MQVCMCGTYTYASTCIMHMDEYMYMCIFMLKSSYLMYTYHPPRHAQPNLEETMVELAYLGSILGMPNIFDPMFPLAYAAFFTPLSESSGSSSVGIGGGSVKMETDESQVHTANVSIGV